ncbi:MAG: XRE family transcriptional regulator [Oscillospiraceae bacterium]
METFASRLKIALKRRNMTAAELSRKLGVNEGTISNYKKGKYEPKQRRLDEISHILDVSIPWLMGADVAMSQRIEKSETNSPSKDDKIISLISNLTDDEKKETKNFIAYLMAKRQENQ